MNRLLRSWKTWLGIAISAAALAWAVRGVDWGRTLEAIARADLALLAAAFALTPIVYVGMRAVRWRVLLGPPRPAWGNLVAATAVGLMANNLLPARLGEFVRTWALSRYDEVSIGRAFGSLMVERVYDGLALVALLVLLALTRPFPPWVEATAWIAGAIFTAALAIQLAIASSGRLARWIARRLDHPAGERGPRAALARGVVSLVEGFRSVRSPATVAASLGLALVQWGLVAVTFRLGLSAFDLSGATGWSGTVFVETVTGLGVAVPSSPGFVGTFHALVVESLAVFGIDRSRAFSFALAFHAINYVSITAVGLAFFVHRGLGWDELERSEERVESELGDAATGRPARAR